MTEQQWLTPYMDRMEAMSFRFFRFLNARMEVESGVSPSQYFMLRLLQEHGRLTVSDLACRLGVSAAGATGLTDRLVKAGLVERCRDEFDRRVVWVEPSPAGCELVTEAKSKRSSIMAALFGALTPEEVAELIRLYEKMTSSIPMPSAGSVGKASE